MAKKEVEAKIIRVNPEDCSIEEELDPIEEEKAPAEAEEGISCLRGSSCACCEEDDDQEEEESILKKVIYLSLALAFFAAGMLAQHIFSKGDIAAVLLVISWLLAGHEVIINAVRKLFSGFLMAEEFLMAVATSGAVILKEYPEAALVMILYQIGEILEHYSVGRSRRSISRLLDISAPYANLIKGEDLLQIDPRQIKPGDHLMVKPGELIPTDGVIISGSSNLNTAAITGEALPLPVSEGSRVKSGSINGDGLLRLEAETSYQDSTASRVMAMVEEASGRKARSESLITRFATVYTPIVVGLAVLLALLPPLLFSGQSFSSWVFRGLIFLVVSCPCAFVISVPLTFVSGLGMASRHGVLVRGGNDLENLANLKSLAFDKTGTLTKGQFSVIFSHAEDDVEEMKFLELAAAMEQSFTHPIAESIVSYGKSRGINLSSEGLSEIVALPGHGVRGVIEKSSNLSFAIEYPATVYLGNAALMKKLGLYEKAIADGCEGQAWTMSHVAIIPGHRETSAFDEKNAALPKENIRYLGHLVIRDEIKDEAASAIAALKKEGISRLALLTGDNEIFAREVAKEVGIEEVHASMLPQDKVSWIEQQKEQKIRGSSGFVGDGLNDAPVLMASDVGIAMGGIGSDAAIEAADVVLMHDDLTTLLKGLIIARKTKNIARQNIVFALTVKFIFLLLAAVGYMPMWLAVFADVGVTLLVIFNCFRIFRIPKLKKVEKRFLKEQNGS